MRIRSFHPFPLVAIPTLVALAAAGCSSEPALDGTWTGSATVDDVPTSFSLKIQESDGAITGTASITAGPASLSGSVEGSYTHPDVTMTLTIVVQGQTLTLRWKGTRTDDDTLTGAATDTDDNEWNLTLRREA